MLTLKEFIATKKESSNLYTSIGVHTSSPGLIYDNQYYIEIIKGTKPYMLTIGNKSEKEGHLMDFEIQLYELYKDNY